MNLQIPNSKLQKNLKSQIPMASNLRASVLELVPWSVLGAGSLGLGAFLLTFLLAQTIAAAQTVLLTGATVHTVSGETLSPGQVLMKEGKIAGVGQRVSAPGARALDLKGQHLYPGLIALNTLLGLTEIEAVRATQDSKEVGDYTPDVESWIAVNPDSELIPVAR